ncbi:MAG: helix-turn-helix domain-containing protein [Gemmobacter sp.]|nr:helix-turn-helix domain-containing protein [Gemmobacter sp.]
MAESEAPGWFSEETATFGDRIAGAREAAGMTQAELARRLGVRHSTVQGWEDDRLEPRANRLQMMAGMLGVSIRWMLTGEGDGPDGPDAAITPDLRAALGELRGLAAEQARLAERMARAEKRLRKALEANRE